MSAAPSPARIAVAKAVSSVRTAVILFEAPENQERGRIKGYYEILCRDLGDEADVAALLSSLKNYIPYL